MIHCYIAYMYYADKPEDWIYYEKFDADSLEEADKIKDKILISWCWRRNLDSRINGATIDLIKVPEPKAIYA